MEALHRQVLPFLLRRMKEDVLQDLPPKIIQDYYCILSPLQVCLKSDWKLSTFSRVKTTKESLLYSWVNLMSALTFSGTTGIKSFSRTCLKINFGPVATEYFFSLISGIILQEQHLQNLQIYFF